MESRLERNRGLQTPTLIFHLHPLLINLLKERISGLLSELAAIQKLPLHLCKYMCTIQMASEVSAGLPAGTC